MNTKNEENQRELPISIGSTDKKLKEDSVKFEEYLKSLNSDDVERLVDSYIKNYDEPFIHEDVVAALNKSDNPKIRKIILSQCINHPEIGKSVEHHILRSISDSNEGIRSLALDMSLSLNLWIHNLKNNRSSFTQRICFIALKDSSENIRSKAAFYTMKLPKEWKKETSPIVLAGIAKNPYLSVKDRNEVSQFLVDHKDFRVRYALSSNSSIKNPLIIDKLCKDSSPAVRAVLSLNPNKSFENEDYLTEDNNALVLYLLSISCSHQNSRVLKKVLNRVRDYVKRKFLDLKTEKIYITERLNNPDLSKKVKKTLETKISEINAILDDEARPVELDFTEPENDIFISNPDLNFQHWNALHLMGLENQHLNDSYISISQIIWKCSVKNKGIRDIKFWQYIERILFKPFLLNSFGDNPEIDFLTQMTKEEYGRD